MATADLPPGVTADSANQTLQAVTAFTEKYHADAAFRAAVEADAKGELAKMGGVPLPAGIDVKVVANTSDLMHVVLPPNPNAELSDEALSAVAGGGDCASTAGTAGTVSTTCGPSTVSTVGSASSLS